MRIVRTEYYFEHSEIGIVRTSYRMPNPGIAALWFKTNTNEIIPAKDIVQAEESAVFRIATSPTTEVQAKSRRPGFIGGMEIGPRFDEEDRIYLLLRFIDISLRGITRNLRETFEEEISPQVPLSIFDTGRHRIPNFDIAREILEQGLVIERSPPENISFESIIRNTSYIGVASWIGMSAQNSSPFLMIISVAGGIIVLGAAVGISKGLSSGLHRAVESAIDRALKRK